MSLSFRGGVRPLSEIQGGKRLTEDAAVKPVTVGQVVIPVGTHTGAPSAPCVKKGDYVTVGQVIADPVGGIGIPVHATVSGTVTAVEERQQLKAAPEMCVVIENDMQDVWTELTPVGDAETVDPALIVPAVKAAGICGMGGAAFPTHIKLSIPEGKSADTVILNASECEPYLTADYRKILEDAGKIADGLRLILRATGVKRGVIAIKENMPKSVEVMRKAVEGREGCEVVTIKEKYPQGAEKTLIKTVTGREVPRGGLPIDAHALVFNVSTAAAIADAVVLGKPLVERIVTVSGSVNQPGNFLARIGTPFQNMIDAAGGLKEDAASVLAGGPMTAPCAPDLTVSVQKSTNGIVVLNAEQSKTAEESPCIRCGRCIRACPAYLMPLELKFDVQRGDYDHAKAIGLMDCTLCGACSYICPAHRHLTAAFKTAREEIAAKARR